jgi:signal transduction histidine kinase
MAMDQIDAAGDADGPVPAPPVLTFPDLPRLELDQLLAQLVARAEEVMASQGRLRGLLKANQLVGAELALETVLHHIVEAARELVGAEYAALGVIAASGGLAEFVHTGMSAETVATIGHLPEGKGLLGALIEDPHPIRLNSIADDPRSIGFPPGHPAMKGFLGAPIEVRGEVYGILYLTESTQGGFTAEDEELACALASTAGAAITNARLYESARSRGEWLQASELIIRRLLSGDTGTAPPLRLIAEQSLKVARADTVTVTVPEEDGSDLRIAVAAGAGAKALQGRRLSREGTMSGRVLADGRPLSAGHPSELGLVTAASAEVDVGPVMVVPLTGSSRTHGALSVCRRQGRAAFTQEDRDLATSFASQAAVAIELAQARVDQQRAAMLDDRERIAEDLHDHVIQKLFAAGMTLQAMATSLPPGRNADRVMMVIDDLDETISQIRTTIFQLQRTQLAGRGGLRTRLLDVATEAAPSLGFEPAVRFSGVMDTLRGEVADDLVAVVREALSNVGRHAQARSAEVDATVRPDRVILDVRDDGTGPGPDAAPGNGLGNLRHRAERHGGSMTFGPREESGSWLRWSVPLAQPGAAPKA